MKTASVSPRFTILWSFWGWHRFIAGLAFSTGPYGRIFLRFNLGWWAVQMSYRPSPTEEG